MAGQVELAEHERRHRGAGDQQRARHRAAFDRGNRVKNLAVGDERFLRVDEVDSRRLRGDGQHFGERADLQFGVHRRREIALEEDVAATDCLEPGEREAHLVSTGTQVDDLVLAIAVGRHRTRFFNQRGARGLHEDARHDRTGRVLDDAGNGCLSAARSRQQENRGSNYRHTQYDSTHMLLPLMGDGNRWSDLTVAGSRCQDKT